jgi:hypothetical protein
MKELPAHNKQDSERFPRQREPSDKSTLQLRSVYMLNYISASLNASQPAILGSCAMYLLTVSDTFRREKYANVL